MYGIVIIHSLSKADLDYLCLPRLIDRLAKYDFHLAPNPHCTLAFIDINMGVEQIPYDESFVETSWSEAKYLWENNKFESFTIDLKDMFLNPQPKRNVSRLTINFTHPEIIKIKQCYLNKFPREKWANYISTPFSLNVPTTYNLGYSKALNFPEEQWLDIENIIKDFNISLENKILKIKELKLVYHQNNFVMDNLKEEILFLK
jgi:hypothetical protein